MRKTFYIFMSRFVLMIPIMLLPFITTSYSTDQPTDNEQPFIITSSYTLSNSTLADLDTSVSDEFTCPPHHCTNYDCYSVNLPSDSLNLQQTNTTNLFQKTIDYIRNLTWTSVFGSSSDNQITKQQLTFTYECLDESMLEFCNLIEEPEKEVDKNQIA